jgi:hypothetical protein
MRGPAVLALLLLSACAASGPGIRVEEDGRRVRVFGLAAGEAERFAPSGSEALLVAVADAGESPLFGEHRAVDGELVFEPRFPLRPGLEYRIRYRPAGLQITYLKPAPPPPPPTRIRALFPSTEEPPENLLKLYLHFTAPMARGEAYRRVRLLAADGRTVDLPFVEIGEELWNPDGTRITLLFDPGRIKRGLRPREEEGPVLEEGKSFTIEVDAGWPDAAGRPLAEGLRKTIRVRPPDDRQPDPAAWTLSAPRAGSLDPLRVLLGEPLDAALLERAIEVKDPAGARVPGRVVVDLLETRWSFVPAGPWKAGAHALSVDVLLEDLAGNSVGLPFEVDLFGPVQKRIGTRHVTRPFEIRP